MTDNAHSEPQSFQATVVGEVLRIRDSAIGMITVRVQAASGEREVTLQHRDGHDGGIAFEDGVLTLSGSPLTYLLRVLEADRMDVELRDHDDETIRGASRIGKWWVSMCGNKRRCYLPWSPERMGLEIKRTKDGRFKSAKYDGKKIDERRANWLESEFGTEAYLELPFGPDLRTDRKRVVVTHRGRAGSSPQTDAARADVENLILEAA